MRILSIDPATKSLAVSILDFNENWKNDIMALGREHRESFHKEKDVEIRLKILHHWIINMKRTMDDIIQLRYVNVFNLIPGTKIDKIPLVDRLQRLKGVVEYIKFVNGKMPGFVPIEKILIEYQMSLQSHDISTALAYAFAPIEHGFSFSGTHMNFTYEFHNSIIKTHSVEIVGPALKGKVYFGSEGRMQNFRKKYMGNYTSNKAHSKYNFLKWIDEHECQDLIKGIPKANIDDIADSFIMAYAWAIKHCFRKAPKLNF